MIAPTLTGDSLRLRAHVPEDFEPFWAFYQTPRAEFVSVPQNKSHAWYGFGAEIASWQLYGMGAWAIEVDGAFAGQISVCQPPHFPEVEIGWILFEGFEGRGLAFEAAQLALDYTWAEIQPPSLVSYIDERNARSIALAQRLGAELDPKAETFDDEDVVFRHRRPS